jgi:hypothetical protein
MARLAVGAAVQQPRIHYATAIAGTDAFIGVVERMNCFKAYLSDGTEDGPRCPRGSRAALAPTAAR